MATEQNQIFFTPEFCTLHSYWVRPLCCKNVFAVPLYGLYFEKNLEVGIYIFIWYVYKVYIIPIPNKYTELSS